MVLELVIARPAPADREALVEIGRAAVARARECPGFLDAWIAEDDDGAVACVLWESREHAEAAADLRARAQGLIVALSDETAPPAVERRFLEVTYRVPGQGEDEDSSSRPFDRRMP